MIGISDRPWQPIPGVTPERTILLSPKIGVQGITDLAATTGPLILVGPRARRIFGIGLTPLGGDTAIFYSDRFILILPHGDLLPEARKLAQTFAMTFGVQ